MVLSSPLRKKNIGYNYQNPHYYEGYSEVPIRRKYVRRKKPKQRSIIASLIMLIMLGLYGYYVAPYVYKHIFCPLILNPILNRNIHLRADEFMYPTENYIHNSFILNGYITVPKMPKSKEISDITIVNEMTTTKVKLQEL